MVFTQLCQAVREVGTSFVSFGCKCGLASVASSCLGSWDVVC